MRGATFAGSQYGLSIPLLILGIIVKALIEIAFRIYIIFRRIFQLIDFTFPIILLLFMESIYEVRGPVNRGGVSFRVLMICFVEVFLGRNKFLLFDVAFSLNRGTGGPLIFLIIKLVLA